MKLTAEQLAALDNLLSDAEAQQLALPAPPDAIPGSPAKIELLRRRVEMNAARSKAKKPLLDLHARTDPQMPPGLGWEIKVLPNGRQQLMALVDIVTGHVHARLNYNLVTGEVFNGEEHTEHSDSKDRSRRAHTGPRRNQRRDSG